MNIFLNKKVNTKKIKKIISRATQSEVAWRVQLTAETNLKVQSSCHFNESRHGILVLWSWCGGSLDDFIKSAPNNIGQFSGALSVGARRATLLMEKGANLKKIKLILISVLDAGFQ